MDTEQTSAESKAMQSETMHQEGREKEQRCERGGNPCLDVQTQTTMGSGSGLLTVNEAAQYLRISRTTLYRLIDRGAIAVVRLSQDPRFLRSDLDAFIHSKREGPMAPPLADAGFVSATALLVPRGMYARAGTPTQRN